MGVPAVTASVCLVVYGTRQCFDSFHRGFPLSTSPKKVNSRFVMRKQSLVRENWLYSCNVTNCAVWQSCCIKSIFTMHVPYFT